MRVLRPFDTDLVADPQTVARSDPESLDSFPDLVKEVARLSNLFPHQLLFFRGQSTDHKNKAGASTLYPSIYRKEPLSKEEVFAKYEVLDAAANRLADRLSHESELKHSRDDIRRRRYVQWSILQHYDLCPTPLLDVTQSLRVACSFASNKNSGDVGYVYVLGLPYLTNRISMNSEEDIVNVRLLSICPAQALRPHFQEGYVVGTLDTTSEYESKSTLDFSQRLVKKFAIPCQESFWKPDGGPIPNGLLYPTNDPVAQICRDVKTLSERMARPGDIGRFIQQWSFLEVALRNRLDLSDDRVSSVAQTVRRGQQIGYLSTPMAAKLQSLRRIRNIIVHRPHDVDPEEITNALSALTEVLSELDIVAAF